MKVKTELKHCFGIYDFAQEFDFSKSNSVLVYAPNGLMKTSFAQTFECIAKNKTNEICDRINPSNKTICNITVDDMLIKPESIFVVNAEDDINSTEKISTLLASKELKNKYDSIHKEIESEKNKIINKIKEDFNIQNCENEIIQTFKQNNKDDFSNCLQYIKDDLDEKKILFNFRYTDIFDKKNKVKEFLGKNKKLITEYFENYKQLIEKSEFFNKDDEKSSFGTYQAKNLAASVSDNSFFKASHKFVLKDSQEITSVDDFQNIIDSEYKKIFSDKKLIDSFNKIDEAIGKNTELRTFKECIEKNKDIIPFLQNYDELKKKTWISYLSIIKQDIVSLLKSYADKKDELSILINEAKQENEDWIRILKLYKDRFFVPFNIRIDNKDDVILKQETPVLIFEYSNFNDSSIQTSRENLLKVLSRGEKRAFFILQFLFEIESRKKEQTETILILDDIADSFDYKNKYAIIEYLKDIHETDTNIFKQIILTHNFDFYRTVASRLYLQNNVFMTICDEHKKIKLQKGEYRKDLFKYYLKQDLNKQQFICLIPFIRNIVEYISGDKTEEYIKLTSCLHKKKESENLLISDIHKIMRDCIPSIKELQFDSTENILDFIIKEADKVIENDSPDPILLDNKLVLSIAIRLKAEEYMIKRLGRNINLETITTNQTRELFSKFMDKYPRENFVISILDRVNLMTAENIHMNAFMYEPLIDISLDHLVTLYKDVKQLISLESTSL